MTFSAIKLFNMAKACYNKTLFTYKKGEYEISPRVAELIMFCLVLEHIFH